MDDHGHVGVQSNEPEYYLDDEVGYCGYAHLENVRLSTIVPGGQKGSNDEYYERDAAPDYVVDDRPSQQDRPAPEDYLDEQHHSHKVRGYPSRLQDVAERTDLRFQIFLFTHEELSR